MITSCSGHIHNSTACQTCMNSDQQLDHKLDQLDKIEPDKDCVICGIPSGVKLHKGFHMFQGENCTNILLQHGHAWEPYVFTDTFILSRNFPFERINSLQCYELTRRCSPLLFAQISPLTYVVYLWPVHCDCAMKHNRRRIFNYLQIRHTLSSYSGYALGKLGPFETKFVFTS